MTSEEARTRILAACTDEPQSSEQLAWLLGRDRNIVRRIINAMRKDTPGSIHISHYVHKCGNYIIFYKAGRGQDAPAPDILQRRLDGYHAAKGRREVGKVQERNGFDIYLPVRCYGIWGLA